MAAQVNFFCFLTFFSVWLAIWCLRISTFVLIKVLLTKGITYLLFANQPGIRVILGAFNAPHINWQTGSCSAPRGFSLNLFEVAEGEFLFQAIKSLTWFREGNNPSLLDLAFPKYPDDVSNAGPAR